MDVTYSRGVTIPGVGVARSRLFALFLGLQLRSWLLFSGVNSSRSPKFCFEMKEKQEIVCFGTVRQYQAINFSTIRTISLLFIMPGVGVPVGVRDSNSLAQPESPWSRSRIFEESSRLYFSACTTLSTCRILDEVGLLRSVC